MINCTLEYTKLSSDYAQAVDIVIIIEIVVSLQTKFRLIIG